MPEVSDTPQVVLANKSFERNIISCALNNPEMLEMVTLEPAAFESPEMATVWSMICDLKTAGHDQITPATLRMFFDAREDFYDVIRDHGGFKFIESISKRPDFINFKMHLEEVTNRFLVRKAKAAVAAALTAVQSGTFTSTAEVYALLDQHFEDKSDPKKEVLCNEITQDWLEEQTRKYLAGEFVLPGMPILNPVFASAFGGLWFHGGMYVWTGETNVGKSQIVQTIMRLFCVEQGIPCLVIDNEMTKDEFRDRMVASAGKVSVHSLSMGTAYDPKRKEYAALKEAVSKLENAPYEWRKLLDFRIERIEPLVRRFLRKYPKEQYPHKMILLDGLKMGSASDTYNEVGFLAKGIKDLADKYSTEGLIAHVTCQLQRPPRQTAKDKAAMPADHNQIGLSKMIADNATDVAVICKHFMASEDGRGGSWVMNRRRIYIPKARNHPTVEDPDFMLMEFFGDNAWLNPLRVEKNSERESLPEMLDMQDSEDVGAV